MYRCNHGAELASIIRRGVGGRPRKDPVTGELLPNPRQLTDVTQKSAALATIHERYPHQNWLHVFIDGSATVSFGRAGVLVLSRLERRVPAQVSSTSLDHGSKFTRSVAKSRRVAKQCDVNNQSINQSGAFSKSFNLKEPLSAWSDNFDGKIFAIFVAFRAISATPGQNVIFIDSQAAIKTVFDYNLFPSKVEFEGK
ncbi:uncharacterized protein LOC103524116 [Trichonephila clavipes]|nr:uncharacterized protein LOC103524116 [Trichonephila clavipes]